MKRALLLLPLLLSGCVSAGYNRETETRTVTEPAKVITETDATGKVTKTEIAAVIETKITRSRGDYSDSTGAGKVAGIALDEFGGLKGIWSALGLTGQLTAVGGPLGLLAMAARALHLSGQNRGYTQAQVEHGGVPGLKRKKDSNEA